MTLVEVPTFDLSDWVRLWRRCSHDLERAVDHNDNVLYRDAIDRISTLQMTVLTFMAGTPTWDVHTLTELKQAAKIACGLTEV